MAVTEAVTIKRGETWSIDIAVYVAPYLLRDLTDVTINAVLSDADGTDHDLTVTKAAQMTGWVTLSATAIQTQAWAAGTAQFDIAFEEGGVEDKSETFTIDVVEAITNVH